MKAVRKLMCGQGAQQVGFLPLEGLFRTRTPRLGALFSWLKAHMCCITLRSRTDASIIGWYDGSNGHRSTDHKRQKLFDEQRSAMLVCEKLRKLYPRNADVINIDAAEIIEPASVAAA